MFLLNLLLNLLQPFNAPEDASSGSGAAAEELSIGETIELLDDTDKEETLDLDDEKEEKETKEEKDKSKDESEESEIESEDLELVTAPKRKEILAKYPSVFKDFPYLEKAFYREQQYSELLGSPDDAKEIVSKAETLDKFEEDLLAGNTEKILTEVKKSDSKAFAKIADNYMTVLAKVDQQAYYHVLGNEVKSIIVSMVRESKNNNNESLQSAAAILNQFVFGTSEFQQPTKLAPVEDNTKQDELSERERAITRRQFESSRDDLSNRVNNVLESTIKANIDPNDSMTSYVKRSAQREVLEKISELIDSDRNFKVIKDRLWAQAFKENFSHTSLDKIKSATLSKARTLLPAVIKQVRNDALKGLGKVVVKDEEESEEKPKNKSIPVGRAASSQNSSPKTEKERAKSIPAGMSSRDFLMQD